MMRIRLVAMLLTMPLATPVLAAQLWTDVNSKRAKPLVTMPSLAPVVQRVEPAVLVVFTEGPITDELPPGHPPIGPRGAPPGGMPEGHGDGGDGDDTVQRGQGAGFLITANGYALTNHHVVEGATRVWAYVGDDKDEIECDVVGSDDKSDVAIIKLRSPKTTWPFLPLADSDAARVGDLVVAIGSPFGLEQSVSLGIVSARGRRDIEPSGRQGLYDFIQTDASINPGNSGGPLIDVYGAVVGINAAINAAGAGIGFAIPINQVKRMLPSMVETGRYQRSWIGVAIAGIDPLVTKGLGLSSTQGALVREVVPGGPGAEAGLAPGDVILTFDGRVVHEANELPLLAGDAGIDSTVTLQIMRDAKPQNIKLTLKSHPDNAARAAKAAAATTTTTPPADAKPTPPRDPSIGLAVVTLDDEHRARLGLLPAVKGARISKLRPGGPAFMAGLAGDDVIVSINGTDVDSADTMATIVKAAPSGTVLKMLARRGGSTVFSAVPKP